MEDEESAIIYQESLQINMENNQELSKDWERRKLQEDIERLRDVIGDDDFNSDDEADENVLQIDFNSTVPTEG